MHFIHTLFDCKNLLHNFYSTTLQTKAQSISYMEINTGPDSPLAHLTPFGPRPITATVNWTGTQHCPASCRWFIVIRQLRLQIKPSPMLGFHKESCLLVPAPMSWKSLTRGRSARENGQKSDLGYSWYVASMCLATVLSGNINPEQFIGKG